MTDATSHRAEIAPVDDGPRPRWSVMVPTFDCAGYLVEALESVLDQDPGEELMQIEVVDDHSSDDPEAVVRRYGDRVSFFRQPRNLGVVGNLNTCIARARGELVHLLHGDDAVRPGFYDALGQAFERRDVGAAFCRFIAIDENGTWTTVAPLETSEDGIVEDWFDRIVTEQRVQTPTMVVRRAIYERLGGFDDRLGGAEDWEMWTRVAASTRVWHVVEPLALYRIRADSHSRKSLRVGENVEVLRKVIELNREVLPPERRDAVTRRALEITALTAIQRARRMLAAGDADAAKAQVRQALRTSRSPLVVERLLEFGLIAARRSLIRTLKR